MKGSVLLWILVILATISCLDPYKVLNIDEEVSDNELSSAYKQLTKKYKKNEHIKGLIQEAYEEIIIERSNEAVEIEAVAQHAAKPPEQTLVEPPRQARVPRHYGRRRRPGRGFIPLVNIATAAVRAAKQSGSKASQDEPTFTTGTQKGVSEVQAQNMSMAKIIVWGINSLLKIIPLALLLWFCVRPQLNKAPQRPDQLRRDM